MITAWYQPDVELKEWVKSQRIRRGWTQEELAERAGIRRVEVNALEAGRNKGTTTRIKESLAKAFGIPSSAVGGNETRIEYDGPASSDRTAIGSHRDYPDAAAEFTRRVGDAYPSDILDSVKVAGAGVGWVHIDWQVIKAIADAEVQARKLRAEREATKK